MLKILSHNPTLRPAVQRQYLNSQTIDIIWNQGSDNVPMNIGIGIGSFKRVGHEGR